jgi:hypothetical protein
VRNDNAVALAPWTLLVLGVVLPASSFAAGDEAGQGVSVDDCNQNGVPDSRDLEPRFRLRAPESFAAGGGAHANRLNFVTTADLAATAWETSWP